MSIDILIFSAEGLEVGLQDAPAGWNFPPMGEADAVRAMVTRVLPETDWSHPAWGRYEGADVVLEFGLPPSGPVTSLGMTVHGSGDFMALLGGLCGANQWVAFDDQGEGFIQNRTRAFL